MVQRAAGHADKLHSRLVHAGRVVRRRGVGLEVVRGGDRRRAVTGPLRLSRQPRRPQILPVLTYLNHGDAVVVCLAPGVALGSLRRVPQHTGDYNPGGGCSGGGGNPGGHFSAPAPPTPALIHPSQGEEGRHSDGVGLPATGEVHAADPMSRGGLEGAEAAADPGPGDVPQPLLPQRGVLWKGVEAQVPVPVRVVVATGDAACESGHVCCSAQTKRRLPERSLAYFLVVSVLCARL